MKKQRESTDYIFEEMTAWQGNKGLKFRLKLLQKSLTTKLVLLFLLAVLPINLMTIYITSEISTSYKERVADSYDFQLNLYAQSTRAVFGDINQELRGFMTMENLVTLAKGSASDPALDMQHLVTQLNESNIWENLPGMSYVWDHDRDILAFTSHGGSRSEISLIRALEDVIRDKCKDEIYAGGREMLRVEEHSYFIIPYDYAKFSIGILIDCGALLQNFQNDQKTKTGEIYLADEAGNVLLGMTREGIMPLEGSAWDLAGRQDLLIEKELGFEHYRILHRISQKEYQESLPQLLVLLQIFCAIGFLAIPLLIAGLLHYVIQPLRRLDEGMEEVEAGNLEYQVPGVTGSYQLDFIYASFNHMVRQLHHLITDSYEREIEKLQTDAINMRLQVNQHMLLNFLNTIYSLASAGKNAQVGEFTQLLMKYFRYVLRQNMALVTVAEEMQFIHDYVRLQKVRFPDSYSFSYSISEEAELLQIPQLLIENFVENSIKYGLVMGKEIEILVNIRCEGDRLLISVCDTGNGMEEVIADKLNEGQVIENRTGKHIGIWNCRRRLRYYYGDDYRMQINSKPQEGTQIWIDIPRVPLKKEDAIRNTAKEWKQ